VVSATDPHGRNPGFLDPEIISYTYFKIYVINLILFITTKLNEVAVR
jgi:hypothetical protein